MLEHFGLTFRVIHGHTSWTQSHDAFADFVVAESPASSSTSGIMIRRGGI